MGVPSWNGGGSGASLIVEPDEKQAQKQEAGRSLRNFSENIHGGLTGFVLLIEELSFIGGAHPPLIHRLRPTTRRFGVRWKLNCFCS